MEHTGWCSQLVMVLQDKHIEQKHIVYGLLKRKKKGKNIPNSLLALSLMHSGEKQKSGSFTKATCQQHEFQLWTSLLLFNVAVPMSFLMAEKSRAVKN